VDQGWQAWTAKEQAKGKKKSLDKNLYLTSLLGSLHGRHPRSRGSFCLLPDGQLVVIESREGESVLVRRIDGPRSGTVAVCSVKKLEPSNLSQREL